ncbi:MAG: amidohydrolase family protein [Alkaliphilus sp.]
MIIDIHGHYFGAGLYPAWVPYGLTPLQNWASHPDVSAIVTSSLDVFSKGVSENKILTTHCRTHPKLWQWLTIDPREPNWWVDLATDKKILGFKVHPTWQQYELTDYLNNLLEVAKIKKWAILTHSGVAEPYVDIKKSIELADRYPEVPVVFAHLGHGFSSYQDVMKQVAYLVKTKNENTLIDTSSLAIHLNSLLKETVKRIGSSRILFGTDMPLHFPESQLSRVTMANLPAKEKEKILWKTAVSFWPKLKGRG